MLLSSQTLLALFAFSVAGADAFRTSSGFPHKAQVERPAEGNGTSVSLVESWIRQKRLSEKVERQIARAKANNYTHKTEEFENKLTQVMAEVNKLKLALDTEQRARVPTAVATSKSGRRPVKPSSTARAFPPSRTACTSSSTSTSDPTSTTSSTSTSTSTSSSTATSSASTGPATTTSTSTSSTASSTATSSSNGTKKGLGYNTASFTTAFGAGLGWAYNWASTPGGNLLSTTEYVPMLWGTGATGWAAAAQSAIDAGATHLLGFNEPDLGSQSNISPTDAAALWKTNMEPFYGKAKLVSPAITNGGPPSGVTWMSEFLGNCTGCHIDAMAAHWYDSATNTGYFTGYFTSMYQEFGLPIWITEFAGSGTVAEQQSFLEFVIPWMETTVDFVERYAAFGDFAGTFVDSTGALTPLGETYANTT